MKGPTTIGDFDDKKGSVVSASEKIASDLEDSRKELAEMDEHLSSVGKPTGDETNHVFNPAFRARLEALSKDLEEKQGLIAELIEAVQPIETNLQRSDSIVSDLRQRIEAQGEKIGSLGKDLLDNRKKVDELSSENIVLKEKVVEKESTIDILKSRLKEKSDLLKEVDEKNRVMEQEVDSAHKKMFAFENKIGAVEERIIEGDERNQRIMYELMKSKEHINQLNSLVAEKDAMIEAKDSEFSEALTAARTEAEEKRRLLLETHARKVAVLNAQLSSLRDSVTLQKRLIDERARQEKKLMGEFNARMRELSSLDADVPVTGIVPEESVEVSSSGYEGEFSDDSIPEDVPDLDPIGQESRMDEILPMVEIALDQGESAEQVKSSLMSSGYSERDVSLAIQHAKQ